MSENVGLSPIATQGLASVADMVGQPAANFANSGGEYTLGAPSAGGDSGGGIGAAIGGIAAAIGAAIGGGPSGGDGGAGPAP